MELLGKILKYFTVFLLGLLILFLVNQVIQFSLFLNTLHPYADTVFLSIVGILILWLLGYSYWTIKTFPAALVKPEHGDDLEEYKQAVLKRLEKNRILQVNGLYSKQEEDIPDALKLLDKEAHQEIMDNAAWVFVSTAISQNGKLDGIITLFIQMKMVYKIAKIYYQKPRLKELYNLYSNVIVTVFLITQIEELNISEHLEPVVKRFSPAKLVGSIPGVGESISLLTNMFFEGGANCFLTLRIGLITQEYCNFMSYKDNRQVRRNATREAAKLLGKIMSQNTKKITRAFTKAVGKAGTNSVKSASAKLKNIMRKPFENKKPSQSSEG